MQYMRQLQLICNFSASKMLMIVQSRNRIERHMMPIFITVMLIVMFQPIARSRIRRCADFGEYCQNHWDCCSNTCMTYLYRCTRNYDLSPLTFVPSYGLLPAPPLAQSTLEDVVALHFGSGAPNAVSGSKLEEPEQLTGLVSSGGEKIDETKNKTELITTESSTAEDNFMENELTQKMDTDTKIKIIPTTSIPVATTKEINTEGSKTTNEDINTTASPSSSGLSTSSSSISSLMPSSTSPLLIKIPFKSTHSPSSDTKTTTTIYPLGISNNQPPSTNCRKIGSKCYRNEHCCTMRCPSYLLKCVT